MSHDNLFRATGLIALLLLLNACSGGGGGGGDTTAPNPPVITSPADQSVIYTSTPVVSGTAEANSTIELFDTDGTTSLGTATAAGGNWSITSSALGDSTHRLTAKATDAAGNTSAASTAVSITVDAVSPMVSALYAAAPDWNDYVKTADTTLACDGSETGGYTACIHGGEKRVVEVAGYSSCTGLTASDQLGAFDWQCQLINSRPFMVSSGLKDIATLEGTANGTTGSQLIDSTASFITAGVKAGSTVVNTTDLTTSTVVSIDSETQLTLADDIFIAGEDYLVDRNKYLSDLIDFSTAQWRNNAVTVRRNGMALFTTAAAAWWNNPLVVDNDGGSLATAGTIYLVTSDPIADYTLDANSTALVVQPGVTLTGSGGGGYVVYSAGNFLWLQGRLEADNMEVGYNLEGVRFSVLRGVQVNNADYNLWLDGAINNLVDYLVTINTNIAGVTTGVYMSLAEYNTFQYVVAAGHPDGITISSSPNNTLSNLIAVNNTRYGIWLSGSTANSLSDITASNNGSTGVYLVASSNNTLSNMATDDNGNYGVWYDGGSNGNTLSDVSASNNTSYGIVLGGSSNNDLSDFIVENNNVGVFLISSSNNNLSNFTATNSGDTGVQLNNSSNNTLSNAESLNNPDTGVSINNSTDNIFNNITSSYNGYAGFYMLTSTGQQLSNITANGNTTYGIYLDTSSGNSISGFSSSGNSEALVLDDSTGNSVADIVAIYNEGGVGLYGVSTANTLTNVTAADNDLGVYLQDSSSNNSLSGITAFNNAGTGVLLDAFTLNNTLVNVTSANNGTIGVYLTNASNNSLANITSVNNGTYGLVLATASNNSLSNISAANNGGTGISIGNSSNNYFTGLLQVGNNFNDCVVSGGTDPGLVHVTCANNGSSDASLTSGITLASSFVGRIGSDDTENASDTNGSAMFPADWTTFDFTSFENRFRGWGIDGVFPGATSRGLWGSGLGSIWDWSADINDTVIRDVLSVPDGNNVISHTWSDASTTVYLRNATEIINDSIGNDNGLCETGETCLFTPNIGSYQGHNALQSAGPFTDGTVTGVTLVEQATNGY